MCLVVKPDERGRFKLAANFSSTARNRCRTCPRQRGCKRSEARSVSGHFTPAADVKPVPSSSLRLSRESSGRDQREAGSRRVMASLAQRDNGFPSFHYHSMRLRRRYRHHYTPITTIRAASFFSARIVFLMT